jgi:hypothetical protein
MNSTLQASDILVPAVIASYTFNANGRIVDIYNAASARIFPETTTEADALANNAYFELKFTLEASCTSLTLSQLKFQVTKGGSTSPRGYVVKAKVGTTEVQLGAAEIVTVYPSFTDVALTIPSSLGLATTCNAESISFLIYSYAPLAVLYGRFELTGFVIA